MACNKTKKCAPKTEVKTETSEQLPQIDLTQDVSLVVTLYMEVLEKATKTFCKHLDHHLKSDNWIKHAPLLSVYLKNNYIVRDAKDFTMSAEDFAEDMQALLDAPTSKEIVAHTKTETPMRGLVQLGNLGHVSFEIHFDLNSKKYKVHCEPMLSYGEEIDVFAAFE